MKLIEKNQLVGLMYDMAVFRDLFEDENGKRHSVPTSKEFDIGDERRTKTGFKKLPSKEELFKKYKLP
jgi:hypothetical protein